MHYLFYAGFAFTTRDALAVAVTRCSAELAAVGRLESVRIPAVYDGEVTQVQLVLGVGMPVAAAPFMGGVPVMANADEALARIEALIAEVTAPSWAVRAVG